MADTLIRAQMQLRAKGIKIICTADKAYNIEADRRLLIPFLYYDKYGLINHEYQEVLPAQYDTIRGDCYKDNDLLIVGKLEAKGYARSNGIKCYTNYLLGVVDASGNVILDLEYNQIFVSDNRRLLTVEDSETRRYAVLHRNGNIFIPYGQYDYIGGFDGGLARVKKNNKWGIINECGDVVLPIEYDDVWNFYKKGLSGTTIVKDRVRTTIPFESLTKVVAPPMTISITPADFPFFDEEPDTYQHYNGSYAQDVMGYSDQTIDDAFDGDPDAYWNIE